MCTRQRLLLQCPAVLARLLSVDGAATDTVTSLSVYDRQMYYVMPSSWLAVTYHSGRLLQCAVWP